MKSFELAEQKQLQVFNSKFSAYLKILKDHIKNTEKHITNYEINLSYVKTIEASLENDNFNCEQYFQLKSLLKDYTFTRCKKEEIDAIIRIFISKLDFEESTLKEREIEKTLDITNDIYADLSKNLIRLSKNFNKQWVDVSLPEISRNYCYNMYKEKDKKENIDVKRDYKYTSSASFNRR